MKSKKQDKYEKICETCIRSSDRANIYDYEFCKYCIDKNNYSPDYEILLELDMNNDEDLIIALRVLVKTCLYNDKTPLYQSRERNTRGNLPKETLKWYTPRQVASAVLKKYPNLFRDIQ